MSRFEDAIGFTLEHEGGYVDHPNDPGGATNWGVSLRALLRMGDDAIAEFDFDDDGDLDADDIRAMPREQAIEFYQAHYWTPEYDDIADQAAATKLFDMGVNMGTRQAVKVLQRAISWYRRDIVVDGIFGPQSLAGTNATNLAPILIKALVAEQARFYFELLDAKPDRRVFIHGWLRRAYSLPTEE